MSDITKDGLIEDAPIPIRIVTNPYHTEHSFECLVRNTKQAEEEELKLKYPRPTTLAMPESEFSRPPRFVQYQDVDEEIAS